MRKFILDLDTGIDDTLAIAYALGSPEVELIGITATYGNVTMSQGIRNDLAITDLFGHAEVPVYAGLPHATNKNTFEVLEGSRLIHGKNGIGDVTIPDSPRCQEASSAIDFIINSAHKYGKDLTYVATGPLTNIAAAVKQDPSIKEIMGGIVIMGGALTVTGNVAPWREANISQDPEAANALFTSGAQCTMVGLDVTLQTLLTTNETKQWRALGTPAAAFLSDMTDYYIHAYELTSPGLGGCGLHDPLAVAVAVDPTLVKTLGVNLKVETDGATRGRTIGDKNRLNDATKTTQVAIKVDVERFLHEFMTRTSLVVSDQQ